MLQFANMVARYAVNTSKALEAILWLANERPGIDVYHVVKAAFYADKDHLNRYGRPVTGDDYKADQFGPLGDVVYGLLKGDPLEILALQSNGKLPFTVDDEAWRVNADRGPNLEKLSSSDVESLRVGLDLVADRSFDELFQLSHREQAYIAADGGRMRYEDLLDPKDPLRKEKAADLAETAASTLL